MNATRRFWIVIAIILLGMVGLVGTFFVELICGTLSNSYWNSVLNCSSPFSGGGSKDPIFSGKKLSCDPRFVTGPVSVYMESQLRNTDADFIPVILGVMLGVGVAFMVPPLGFRRWRGGNYIRMMELVFGVVGMTSISVLVVIGLTLSEIQDVGMDLVNGFDSKFPDLVEGQVFPLPVCHLNRTETEVANKEPDPNKGRLCVTAETWHVITLKCVFNGEGFLTQMRGKEVKKDVRKRNKGWKSHPIKFNGSRGSYSYGDLQTLGFCPWLEYRIVGAVCVFVAIVCFCGVAVLACCRPGGGGGSGETSKMDEHRAGGSFVEEEAGWEEKEGTERKIKVSIRLPGEETDEEGTQVDKEQQQDKGQGQEEKYLLPKIDTPTPDPNVGQGHQGTQTDKKKKNKKKKTQIKGATPEVSNTEITATPTPTPKTKKKGRKKKAVHPINEPEAEPHPP